MEMPKRVQTQKTIMKPAPPLNMSSATFINVLSITASIPFLTQSNFGGIHEGIEDVVL